MEKLSVIESALMLSLKMHPNNHAVFHARAVSATVLEIDRAVAALKRLNYVIQDNSGRLTLNEHTIKRANTDLMHAEQKPVVHRVAESAPVLPVTKAEKAGEAPVTVYGKPTPETLLAQLTVQRNKGMTAGDMAKHYGGYDGRSLVQLLRKMKTDGLVTKFGNMWYAATQEDKVEHIEVPYETRRAVTNSNELQKLIKLQKGWFTAKESYDELSKAFIVDWSLFYGVFMEMAGEGHFNVKENGVLVSYEHSYDADNKHANCRWDDTIHDAEKFNKVVQDYIYLVQQGGSQRWSLEHCVEITKIQSGMLLHWFELAGFDVDDIDSIGPKVAPGFTPFDRLDSVKVQEFIGAEGCRVTAFMKAFNLDPDTTEKVCSLLELVNIARYDAENKFLMLPQTKKIVEAPEEPAPRVTSDPVTGEETIQMIQEPNEGFVFFEVVCEANRPVAAHYQLGNSCFNGMPITPTDDPEIYMLQVPDAFKFEAVDVEGMYEHVTHDEPQLHKPTASSPHFAAQRIEERAAEQKENPPEKMYFNGEKPVVDPAPFTGNESFVKEMVARLRETIEGDSLGKREPEVEHSSMLQIDRPLVGMHLFRTMDCVVSGNVPLPETVEDENSPYFGCKITPCDGEHIGYATITIEPGHPMWQPPRYAYTSDRDKAVFGDSIVPEDEDIFGADADPLSNEPDGDPEAEEYAANLEPHLKHLLKALAGVPTKEDIFEMVREANDTIRRDSASVGVKGTPESGVSIGACKAASGGGTPLPVRTVKPEWTSGLALIADQHKRSSSTYKLLMEIKEYLEK
jgi:hypothetical protein